MTLGKKGSKLRSSALAPKQRFGGTDRRPRLQYSHARPFRHGFVMGFGGEPVIQFLAGGEAAGFGEGIGQPGDDRIPRRRLGAGAAGLFRDGAAFCRRSVLRGRSVSAARGWRWKLCAARGGGRRVQACFPSRRVFRRPPRGSDSAAAAATGSERDMVNNSLTEMRRPMKFGPSRRPCVTACLSVAMPHATRRALHGVFRSRHQWPCRCHSRGLAPVRPAGRRHRPASRQGALVYGGRARRHDHAGLRGRGGGAELRIDGRHLRRPRRRGGARRRARA